MLGDEGRPTTSPASATRPAATALGPMSGSDIVLFKSTDGGHATPARCASTRIRQNGDADQFQPWIAVTPSGQVNVSFFDRRNDPSNYFIDTYLARSKDGGESVHRPARVGSACGIRRSTRRRRCPASSSATTRASSPTTRSRSRSGTTRSSNNLSKKSKRYSPWQEVLTARVPNGPVSFITKPKRKRVRAKRLVVRGRALDAGTGQKLRKVRIAVRRKAGRSCAWHVRGRWQAGGCKKRRFQKARGTAKWRYVIRRQGLVRGRYRIETRAVGLATRRERVRERGRNVVKFRVRRGPGRSA